MIRFALTCIAFPLALCLVIPASAQELPIPVAHLQRSEPVDFANEIMPILKRNCLACHHEKEAEGGLILESADKIHQGGDSGSSVDLDAPTESILMVRATGAEEPLMPPEDNAVGAKPLTPDELGLLKLWIEQGAKGSDAMGESIQWQEIPESVRTSLALSISPDGQIAALGRGNRVVVVDMETYQPSGYLVDPEVLGGNAAHVDLVQSIAIAPDAQRIATGGFRTVKIWKKEPLAPRPQSRIVASAGGIVAISSDSGTAAIVNAIGDIEIWGLKSETTPAEPSQTLRGHTDRISGLCWAGSTGRLVSCDSAGRLIVWKTDSGDRACELQTEVVLIDLAVSDSGDQVAAIDLDGKLHRFEVSSDAAAIHSLTSIPPEITKAIDVVFAAKPNPQMIVSDESAGVLVVAPTDAKVVRKLDHGSVVDALAVSPDGALLLTGGRDGKIRTWDLSSGEPGITIHGDPRGQLQLAYAQRQSQRQKSAVERLNSETAELEKRLASEKEVVTKAREEQTKAAASVEENEKKHKEVLATVTASEKAIAIANEEANKANAVAEAAKKMLASSTEAMELLTKEIAAESTDLSTANEAVQKLQDELAAITKKLEQANARAQQIQTKVDEKNASLTKAKESIAKANEEIESAKKRSTEAKASAVKAAKQLEEQKKKLASAEEAKTKSEAELAKRQQALETATQAQKRAEAAIPAHKHVIEAETRKLALLDQRLSRTQNALNDPDRQVVSVAVDPAGQLVASSHRDGAIRVYQLDSGQPITEFESELSGWSGLSTRVTWFGQDVIAFGKASTPELWSTRFGWTLERTIGSLDDPTTISDRVTAMDFRQDGLSIAVGSGPPSRSGEVKVFAVETGALVRDFGEVHSDTVLGLAFSPRGGSIASSAADKTIRLLDVTSGEVTRSLEGHTHHVLSIAWQDDGQSIASASADRTVKVWDAKTGEQRRTISGFGKEITAVEFVSASNQLATACADGQVRLYDASNGKSLRTFNAGGDFLFALDVSLDGKSLLAAGQSGVLRVWNVEDGKLRREIE